MSKAEAEAILGLSGIYDRRQFIAAYRSRVKLCHPDAGGSDEAMSEVNLAKEYLEFYFEDDKDCVIECSNPSESEEHDAEAPPKDEEASAQWRKDESFASAAHGAQEHFEKDSPFTSGEYASKPQHEWAEEGGSTERPKDAHAEGIPNREDLQNPSAPRSRLRRFIARHQTGLGWLFVYIVYRLSVGFASVGFNAGAFGLSVAFAIEIAAIVAAIVFRKRFIKALIGE